MHALAGVRYFTRKRKVLVFRGGYHGGVFSLWDGVQENGIDKHEWIIGKYNDVEVTPKLIEQGNIAAVLVEGMQGAGGCISGSKEFLMQIQESAKKVFTLVQKILVVQKTLPPLGELLTIFRSEQSSSSTK